MAADRAAERRKAEEAAAKAEKEELRALLASKKVDEKVRLRLALAQLQKEGIQEFLQGHGGLDSSWLFLYEPPPKHSSR